MSWPLSGRGGFWAEIGERFLNPLVIQLLVILAVSYFMSLDASVFAGAGTWFFKILAYLTSANDLITPIIVGGMILISVFLAYFQERRSSQAAENLKKMVQASAVVLRDGKEAEVRMSELAHGDIVVSPAAGSIISCGSASAVDQGLLRQSVGADRRVHACREVFHSRPFPNRGVRSPECLLSREHRRLGSRPWHHRQHRHAYVPGGAFGQSCRSQRRDGFRQRHQPFRVAHDPFHGGHGQPDPFSSSVFPRETG